MDDPVRHHTFPEQLSHWHWRCGRDAATGRRVVTSLSRRAGSATCSFDEMARRLLRASRRGASRRGLSASNDANRGRAIRRPALTLPLDETPNTSSRAHKRAKTLAPAWSPPVGAAKLVTKIARLPAIAELPPLTARIPQVAKRRRDLNEQPATARQERPTRST